MSAEKSRKCRIYALGVSAIAAVILIAIAWTTDTLPPGSRIGGVSVGSLSAAEAEKKINTEINKVEFKISDKPFVIEGKYVVTCKDIRKLIKRASVDPLLRLKLIEGMSLKKAGFSYVSGIEETAKVLDEAGMCKGDAPKDAYIDLEEMTIVPEKEGTEMNTIEVSEALFEAIMDGYIRNMAREEYLIEPKVRADDENLLKELEYDKAYLTKMLTIVYPDKAEYTFTRKELSKFSIPDRDGDVWHQMIDMEAIESYIQKQADYAPIEAKKKKKKGKKTLYNTVVTGKLDVKQASEDIKNALENDGEVVVLKWESLPGADTRVEVSIDDQTLWYIENGKTVFSTKVVTGGPGYGTTRGIFSVAYKTADVFLEGYNADGSKYRSHVNWWMPFNADEGLHDASWRTEFGGNIYKTNGSHGCVNMPESYAARLYKKVDAGTVVMVY